MATTTATITLSSSDITDNALSISNTATLTTAGTDTGISEFTGIARKKFANASEFSFISAESCFLDLTPNLIGFQGGYVHTVASASDGVSFEMESSVNMNTGAKFTLYKVV